MTEIRSDISLGILISSSALSFSVIYLVSYDKLSMGWIIMGSVLSGLVAYRLIREKIIKRRNKNGKNRKG